MMEEKGKDTVAKRQMITSCRSRSPCGHTVCGRGPAAFSFGVSSFEEVWAFAASSCGGDLEWWLRRVEEMTIHVLVVAVRMVTFLVIVGAPVCSGPSKMVDKGRKRKVRVFKYIGK